MNKQRRGWYEQKQYIRHLHKSIAYKHHKAAIKSKRYNRPAFHSLEIYRPSERQLVNWDTECVKTGNCDLQKVYLTPDSYLDFQKKMLGRNTDDYTPEQMFWAGVNRNQVERIKKDILDGKEVPAFSAEFDKNGTFVGQPEDRHRVIAVKELGVQKVPVWLKKRR